MAADLERRGDRLANADRQSRGIQRLRQLGMYHRKLVAAEARDGIGFANATAQAIGHDFQKLVADRMAERVIDLLEFVEVEIKQGNLLAALGCGKRLFELGVKAHAIGQVGQSVVMRHMRDLPLRAFALGHVVDHREQVLRLALGVADCELLGQHHPDAMPGRLDHMVVDNDRPVDFQRVLIARHHEFGLLRRIELMGVLSDHAVARNSEKLLAGAIDQDEPVLMRVFHDDRCRHMLDDGVKECPRPA